MKSARQIWNRICRNRILSDFCLYHIGCDVIYVMDLEKNDQISSKNVKTRPKIYSTLCKCFWTADGFGLVKSHNLQQFNLIFDSFLDPALPLAVGFVLEFPPDRVDSDSAPLWRNFGCVRDLEFFRLRPDEDVRVSPVSEKEESSESNELSLIRSFFEAPLIFSETWLPSDEIVRRPFSVCWACRAAWRSSADVLCSDIRWSKISVLASVLEVPSQRTVGYQPQPETNLWISVQLVLL